MNKLSETKVSFFNAPILNTEKLKDLLIPEVYQLIKSDYKKPTSYMRSLQNEKLRAEYKRNNFPYVTFSGSFSKRNAESLITHSNLLALDLDNLGSDLHRVKQIIITNPRTKNNLVMLFISPSGTGLKVIYHIDITLYSQEQFYEAISKYHIKTCGIPEEYFDKGCKDVSRACFLCHDPDAYLNSEWSKDSMEPFQITNDLLEQVKKEPQFIPILLSPTDKEECEAHIVKILIKIVLDSKDGEKDAKLSKAAYFAGGCVAGNFISEERARETLRSAIKLKPNVENFEDANRTIEAGIKSGKNKPVNRKDLKIRKINPDKSESDVGSNIFDSIHKIMVIDNSYRRNEITTRIERDGKPVTEQEINSVYIDLTKRINLFPKPFFDVYINSENIPQYNPLKDFIAENIHITGEGSIVALAKCLQCKKGYDYTLVFLKRFLIGMVASIFDRNNNVLFLVLVGGKNLGKTYFFKNLLPKKLNHFFTSNKLDQGKDSRILMTEMLLILNDELDGFTKNEGKTFRNFISADQYTDRAPYGRFNITRKRLASVCGTSNDINIILDPENNRRTIPIEVIKIYHDDYNSIDKTALFMEAYHLYKSGERWELSNDEIKLLNESTEEYGVESVEVELIHQCFSLPEGNEECIKLTSTEIKQILDQRATHHLNLNNIGKALRAIGFKPETVKRTGTRSNKQVYSVIKKFDEEEFT